MVRCVAFDLDGTLVDMRDLFYRIFADVVRPDHVTPRIGALTMILASETKWR